MVSKQLLLNTPTKKKKKPFPLQSPLENLLLHTVNPSSWKSLVFMWMLLTCSHAGKNVGCPTALRQSGFHIPAAWLSQFATKRWRAGCRWLQNSNIWHRNASFSGCLECEKKEKSIPCHVDVAASMEAIQKMTGYPLSAAGVAKFFLQKDSCPYL